MNIAEQIGAKDEADATAPQSPPADGALDRVARAEHLRLLKRETTDAVRLEGSRWISLYEPHAAFSLVDELQHLSRRAIEPNLFFEPRFLVPAMPRLDDKAVRLIVARDEAEGRSRLRFFMPFSVEAMASFGRRKVVRTWTHPFGRLGVPPLDTDDPDATAASLFDALRSPAKGLPPLLVLPDLPLEGPLARLLMRTALSRGLSMALSDRSSRAVLDASTGDPDTYLRRVLGPKRHRDHGRRLRLLKAQGALGFEAAGDERSVREAFEDFLYLEAAGWKGRAGSALLQDRHRAAFAREAVNGLAAQGGARVYSLRLNGEAIGSLVVLLSNGRGVAWKTAYDERFAKARPGALVAALATEAMIADPAIGFVDSCAVPDHGILNPLWPGRMEMGTLVVALDPAANGTVPTIAADLERHRRRLRQRWQRRARLRDILERFTVR
ncbi:GNAT family N-acetyltransferase [Aureimonas sp. AU40]|uniref:GNAT family N-acetyltransferase n=1 Tax=Aureimonas sp. AU40 TaxID=1637747 RepID=UPI0007802E60|nr:GNAT family N-acetyltransferase [Aureimonas sp. AU40]